MNESRFTENLAVNILNITVYKTAEHLSPFGSKYIHARMNEFPSASSGYVSTGLRSWILVRLTICCGF